MNKRPIFTVTTMQEASDPDRFPDKMRSVGFYHTRAEAVAAVRKNAGHLSECGYYDYLVIEEIRPGIYAYSSAKDDDAQIWYKAEFHDQDSWKRCKRPRWAKGICNWSLG